ncbi:MAG: hydrogenase expression/formation protein HypE [Desulfovibrio sp.]|jgi:hydrogenase expression/formation protein HypE|nr:hydrogenase expression/formation protein HypE [Desulfovibrio sp.]
MNEARVLLDYGSGGKAAHRLVTDLFVRHFSNPILATLNDAALLEFSGQFAMSTDGYTVDPLEFPGGDIGRLAVHGTVNDVSMLGARPLYLSCAFILEEGLPMPLLERIVASMGEAAREAGVRIVTGDTKVVPRGAADKLFITTTGIGEIIAKPAPSGNGAKEGDAILLSGSVGDHGLTILAQREGLSLDADVASDSAALHHMVAALVTEVGDIHVLRDPTRGGLATTLNEIALQSGVVCAVREADIPVRPGVAAGCAVLGLDPLYLANEGKLLCCVPEEKSEAALHVMRRFAEGRYAAAVGRVEAPGGKTDAGQTLLQTRLGGRRLLGMLEGEQLPRIC